jgi:hypothetical protein
VDQGIGNHETEDEKALLASHPGRVVRTIMSLLTRLFQKRPVLTGYVYESWRHTGWGDAIGWSNYKERRVHGWLWRRPQVGDEIRWKMESSKVARFIVTDVEYCYDPDDMFFADVMDIGYVGEPPINKVKEAKVQEIEPSSGMSSKLFRHPEKLL